MMGWTGVHNPYKTTKEYIKNEWFTYSDKEKFEMLALSMVGNVAYMAIKYIPTGEVYAEVVLTSVNNKDYHNLSYKEMSENCGPYYYNCPSSILKMLTPTDNEQSNEWRAKCWETINNKKKTPKIENGTTIKFKNPISFTNGDLIDTFTIRKFGKRINFIANGKWYSISKWRKRDFEIVA
jgi:hypothetical protein